MENADLLKFLFDRPDSADEWYFQEDFEEPDLTNHQVVRFCCWLFNENKKFHENFSEKQLYLGFNYLINSSCSSCCYSFLDKSVDVDDRLLAIHGMLNVFRDLFAFRCEPTVMNLDRGDVNRISLNKICYMWWDVFPCHGIPYSSEIVPIDDAVMFVLREILDIESLACKESALHGLGHWHSARPDQVAEIIKKAIPILPAELVPYAINASKGNIQ